jgi:hypothetical protein
MGEQELDAQTGTTLTCVCHRLLSIGDEMVGVANHAARLLRQNGTDAAAT